MIERLRRSWGRVLLGVVLTLGVGVSAILAAYLLYLYPEQQLGPAQPVAFSHRLHVTDKHIDCAYCHPYTDTSLSAGLPTLQTCLGCHEYIIPEHPEIRKLHEYDRTGTNPPWVKVFYAPDHAWFPHYRHVPAILEYYETSGRPDEPFGKPWAPYTRATMGFYRDYDVPGRPCLECHGAIEAMDRLPVHTYYMGFCLDCHRQLEASLECTACHQ